MLACLTILVGPAALTEPDHLKLIVKTIPVVAVAHPWKPQACLHGIVWRCLIWNFSLTPYMPRSKAMEGDHDWRNVLRQRATDDIKQAQVEGVGAWLVCALLGKNEKPFAPALANRLPRNADVVRTINVLRGLLEHPHRRLFSEGVAVLGRLTSDVGDETSRRELLSVWDSAAVLPQELLDGTIVEAELRHLAGLEKRVKPFHVGSIRSLCRAEVEEHWEQLLEVWVLAARRVFTDDRVLHLMSDILHVWQTLLLAQAQLTPSYDHLTFTPDYSSRVLSIVKDFLAWDIHRFVQLGSAKQLWMVMKRVFAVPWLQDAAESILRVLLSSRGSDEPGDTLEAYRELCIDLSFSGKPDMLGSIAATSEDVVLSHKAGELWFSVAPLWTLRNPTPAWQSTAVFLSVPWKFATPADAQRTIWTNLFSFAVLCAGETGYSVNSVLEELSRHFSTVTADLLLCLLSYMRFNDGITIPLTLLQRVDDYIRLYPIQSQDIYPAINVIDALSQSISTCSAGSIVPVLRSLQAGMRLWIQTGPDLVSDDEYDQHIMGFYCNSLDSLYRAVDSVQVLRDLEEYLCAPFENIRKEAIGPLTFKSFWDRISSRLDLDNDNGEQLPEKLKTSLCAIYDAYGGDRPAYLPKDSQSQDVV
ncbi:hypothetical protein BC835DRAFT_1086038 [Cytidiella melzeri]|nr:hypothetical protein BC835DRAFT_1086038 [Cytidiella melzeri]